MNITPINNNFSQHIKLLNKNNLKTDSQNSTELSSMSEITGRSLINFKSAQLHKLDKVFINNIATELKFSKENITQFTQILSDFLKKGCYKSLGDIAGEENIDIQCDFIDEFIEKFKISDDKIREYFIDEFTNRCDDKDNYTPSSFANFNKENIRFENLFINTIDTLRNDTDKFNNIIAVNIGLNKEQSDEFKSIVSDYLKSNNMLSLRAMKGDDYLNEQSELVSILSAKFDLTENEEDILSTEMINFIYSKAGNYIPVTTYIDKDFDIFNAICEKNNIDEQARMEIFINLKDVALKNNASNLFEIFTNPNINDKYISSLPIDFLIDLSTSSKNNLKIKKHPQRDKFYNNLRDNIILENLQEKYNLSQTALENIQKEISKRRSDNTEIKSIEQLAYEIADKYNLNSGAEKEIKNIILSSDTLDYRALDVYFINKLTNSH